MLKKSLQKSMVTLAACLLSAAITGQTESKIDCNIELDRCVTTLKKTLATALTQHDMNLFAEQFNYPFRINLSCGTRIIHSKEELIKNFNSIFNEKDINEMRDKKNLEHNILTSQGAAVFAGMWASTSNAKIFVINAPDKSLSCDLPVEGTIIQANQDIRALTTFSQLYNEQIAAKDQPEYSSLKIATNDSKDSPLPKQYLADATTQYALYTADINNDGEIEYVLVFVCNGNMCSSDVSAVYQLHDNKLQPVNYDLTADEADLYFNANADFISVKNGKYFLHYNYRQPAETCTYLWEKNKFNLVKGSTDICLTT